MTIPVHPAARQRCSKAAAVPRVTYQEFLASGEGEHRAEWVAEEVIHLSPVSRQHQIISRFLLKTLTSFVEEHDAGEIFFESFQMKTGPHLPGRSPDIFFLAREHLHRLRATHLEGPADLVIEIISAESRQRDREEKFVEYQTGKVPEYWLVDPENHQVEILGLNPDRELYEPLPALVPARHESRVLPGFWIHSNWLWQSRSPTLPQVLAAWKVASC